MIAWIIAIILFVIGVIGIIFTNIAKKFITEYIKQLS